MVVGTNSAVDDIRDLVRQVKEAVNAAIQDSTDSLAVTQLDLEIKTILKKTAGGEINLKVIELGGSYTEQEMSTIEISLEPGKILRGRGGKRRDLRDDLSEAVKVIQEAVREAERIRPRYGLKKAKITLQVGKTTEGKVALILEGEKSKQTTHKVVLTLAPPS